MLELDPSWVPLGTFLIVLAAALGALVKFIWQRSDKGQAAAKSEREATAVRLQALEDTLPESFVPRREMNGQLASIDRRLSGLEVGHDRLWQKLDSMHDELHRRLLTLPEASADQGKQGGE